jgi:hypothetical protein
MSWFPLARDYMEHNSDFHSLTPTEKVYFIWLVSEANLRGPFYCSDMQVAVTLNTAEVTIRKARRKLSRMGWIGMDHGFMDARGRGVATRYAFVLWSVPAACQWFAQVPRQSLGMLLHISRAGRIQPADVLVYLCLCYQYWKSDRDEEFSIPKSALCEMSGLHEVNSHLDRLYNTFTYSSGLHLFEYTGYHSLRFSKWAIPASPDESEANRKMAESWVEDIKERLEERRYGK